MKNLGLFLLFLFITATACTKNEDPATLVLPSNLEVTISVSPTTEGLVSVKASALATNYYEIEFFNGSTSKIIENAGGNASYQYTATGTYKIVVRAHATFSNFITKTDSVNVTITQPVNGVPATGYTTPLSYAGYNLVWQDEFVGTALSNDWTQEIGVGNNGWGNNELQYYRAENTEVRDGYLFIKALKQEFNGRAYTSSRIITKGAKSFKYGRVDIRAALPKGQGMWPALWMLGDNISSVGWPKCGEIDIMELVGGGGVGRGDNYVHGTAHWDDNGQHASFGDFNKLSSGTYADEFHVFSIIWDATTIKWYRDNIKYHELTISGSELSEFRQNFFFIFNVAVGGDWPGSPDASTQFPQHMVVDYVRVFQK